jgi:GNAT superfamily N-acetyltransferase
MHQNSSACEKNLTNRPAGAIIIRKNEENQVKNMLHIFEKLKDLSFSQLMEIYEEGNRENGVEFWPDLDPSQQLLRAEQDFYAYLRDEFYTQRGASYAVWVMDGNYVSALRLEPWEDGLLLEALETHPNHRKKGYAKDLINAVQESLPEIPVYSHVNKRNTPSLATHKSCGFQILKDTVRYLDGTVSAYGYTLLWQRKP